MLDRKTEMMLDVANTLTANDLDFIHGVEPAQQVEEPPLVAPGNNNSDAPAPLRENAATTGERERLRTRESKVSTACVGGERQRHDWWPIGTELTGAIGNETFTAQVVENPRVKSGRGVLITSGSAQGTLCNTPTRAALEATEAYRDANNLGRAGGVTNGWSFWKPKTQD